MRYWNGYHWVDDESYTVRDRRVTQYEREALYESELLPRTVTTEDCRAEIEMVAKPEDDDDIISRHTEVFTKNSPRLISEEIKETITKPRTRTDLDADTWATCEKCDSQFNKTEGSCPVCLMLHGSPEEIAAHLSKKEEPK